MQRTHASASKKRMPAYLLTGILRMLGKMHDSLPGRGSLGSWQQRPLLATKNVAREIASVGIQRTFGNRERCLRHPESGCLIAMTG